MIPPNLLHLREPGTDPACSKGEKLGAELSFAICHMGVPNTNHVSILGAAFPNAGHSCRQVSLVNRF